MAELIYPPANQVWPPHGANGNGVFRHVVKRKQPRPDKNETQGPVESLVDICDMYEIPFAVLVEFNFGLHQGEPRYFEKINWFLKYKLNCKKKTEQGNFIFSGGEVIYVPAATVIFDDAPPIIVARRTAGIMRWVQFSRGSVDINNPNYMIPGIDRTSESIKSALPGLSGRRDRGYQAGAALVQFLATSSANRLADYAVETHLHRLEPSLLQGGKGLVDKLQPSGQHEGVVVMIRRTKSKLEPSFPALPFGRPIVVGFGDARDIAGIIARFDAQGNYWGHPEGNDLTLTYEYYWGTRL